MKSTHSLFAFIGSAVSRKSCNVRFIRFAFHHQDIKSIFREESQKDHTYMDCFLSFIISPGVRGHFYGTDGGKVSIEDDIVMPLCERCPSLLNKPKIFFILACQGGMWLCLCACVCYQRKSTGTDNFELGVSLF